MNNTIEQDRLQDEKDARARKRGAHEPGGLSTAHISPQGDFIIYPDGELVTTKRPQSQIRVQRGGGLRGKATFSRASRRRLLHKCASTQKKINPLLVTLTYPGEFPGAAEIWKTHLDKLAKRFFRKFPDAGFAWKLESQKRGAPHYHLMVWGVGFIWLYAFISINWYEVVGSGDEKHLRAGTKVEHVRHSRGSKTYFAKYIGKTDNTWTEGVGRYWGFRGIIPWSSVFEVHNIGDKTAIQMIRYQKRYMTQVVKIIRDAKGKKIREIKKPITGRGYQSLTCMVDDPMRWAYLYQYTKDNP